MDRSIAYGSFLTHNSPPPKIPWISKEAFILVIHPRIPAVVQGIIDNDALASIHSHRPPSHRTDCSTSARRVDSIPCSCNNGGLHERVTNSTDASFEIRGIRLQKKKSGSLGMTPRLTAQNPANEECHISGLIVRYGRWEQQIALQYTEGPQVASNPPFAGPCRQCCPKQCFENQASPSLVASHAMLARLGAREASRTELRPHITNLQGGISIAEFTFPSGRFEISADHQRGCSALQYKGLIHSDKVYTFPPRKVAGVR